MNLRFSAIFGSTKCTQGMAICELRRYQIQTQR
jgi:hypothetical protein